MIAKERLYLTADRTAIVKEGDARAAFLLIAPGQDIPECVLGQYGLSSKELVSSEDKESILPEDKGGLKITPQAVRVNKIRPSR